jgi:4-hydroxybenzoate polyprenyltransferase
MIRFEESRIYPLYGYSRTLFLALHLCGIEFWIVAVGPLYIGWALATRNFYPDLTIILGFIIVGPLIGGFTFLYDDYYDYEADRENKRKELSLLLMGWIEPKIILYGSIVLCVAGLILSFILSPILALLMGLAAILSVLYSHPSTKLKSKGGFDLLTNVIGIGIIVPLGGWVIGNRPLEDFPIFYLMSIAIIIGGLYAPTTVVDYEVDKKNNLNTLAVRFGVKKVIYLSHFLIIVGFVSLVSEALYDYVLTREILFYIWPFLVAQPIIYFFFLRKPTYKMIATALVLASAVCAVGTILFMAYYTGVWVL